MRFIVTGASSGIGFAAAESLAIRHHDVIAVARNVDRLSPLNLSYSDHVQIISADLSTPSERSVALEQIKLWGNIDGIIHAAGSRVQPTDYVNLEPDNIVKDMNIHVAVPIAINNELRVELAGGRILYIDSYSASTVRVGWAGYSIVKAAAQMAARAAAEEIPNATIIRVFPGAVHTPLVESVLATKQKSPAVYAFKEMESTGKIREAKVIGEYIADILVTATDEQLAARKYWDFNNSEDRIF